MDTEGNREGVVGVMEYPNGDQYTYVDLATDNGNRGRFWVSERGHYLRRLVVRLLSIHVYMMYSCGFTAYA
jgi:hypothetical protein